MEGEEEEGDVERGRDGGRERQTEGERDRRKEEGKEGGRKEEGEEMGKHMCCPYIHSPLVGVVCHRHEWAPVGRRRGPPPEGGRLAGADDAASWQDDALVGEYTACEARVQRGQSPGYEVDSYSPHV